MLGSIGIPELALIFLVVLVVIGPKQLPEFARMLGKLVREFRTHVEDAKATISAEIDSSGLDLRKDLADIRNDLNGSINSFKALVESPAPPVAPEAELPPPAWVAEPVESPLSTTNSHQDPAIADPPIPFSYPSENIADLPPTAPQTPHETKES
jgi:Tat protein translocase TatB subunit